MQVTKVEDFIGTSLAKDVLKKAVGDSPEFDIVYEALMQKAKNEELTSVDTKVDNSYYPTGVGQRLDSLPMKVNQVSNEGTPNNINNSAKDLKWDYQIYNENKNRPVSDTNKVNNSNLDSSKNDIYEAVDKYATKYGVDKNLILGIIKQESNFDANAVSSSGAMGVMQLMDFNCEAYGVKDPFNVDQNVEAGVKHIKEYLNMFNGDVDMALMAYNGGPGTMERRGVKSPADLYKMPQETQNYVPKVKNYYKNGI